MKRQKCNMDLTKRENEIMALVAAGLSNKEICKNLNITIGTLKNHIVTCYEKYGIFEEQKRDSSCRVRAALKYLQLKGNLLI